MRDLGRFPKHRPVPFGTTPPYATIGLFALIAAWAFYVFVAAPAFERVNNEYQEQVDARYR